MSRIDLAWRRAGRPVADTAVNDFSIDAYPKESGESTAPAHPTPVYREASAYREPSYSEPAYKEPSYKEPSYKEPSYKAASYRAPHAPIPQASGQRPVVALPTEAIGRDVAPGVVAQCARLVDTMRARAQGSALDIVVVTTPVANEHAAQAAIHMARLLAATDGGSVMLVDASVKAPRVSALFGIDQALCSALGSGPIDVSLADVPSMQLAILDVEQHSLAGRLRALAEQSGARWVVAHAPAFADMPDNTAIYALARVGDGVILVLPASTPTPVIGAAVAAVGRERLLGTVLVGIDGL